MAKREMATFGIKELVEDIRTDEDLGDLIRTKKDTAAIIKAVFDYMTDRLVRGEQGRIPDFGIFTPVEREARIAHDPRNPGTKIEVPAKTTITFKLSSGLKNQMPDCF